MLPKHYTRIVLAERPKTNITPTTFRKETVAFDLKPEPGEVLVRVDWLSLDPAMRGWIKEIASYIEPVRIGAVMRATGLGTVIEAGEGCELRPGDVVTGFTGETLESFWTLCCDRDFYFAFSISPRTRTDHDNLNRLDGVCRHEEGGNISKNN